MFLGISSSLQHSSPEEWAAKHKALGLETVNFPVTCDDGEDVFMAYKKAADEAGLTMPSANSAWQLPLVLPVA